VNTPEVIAVGLACLVAGFTAGLVLLAGLMKMLIRSGTGIPVDSRGDKENSSDR